MCLVGLGFCSALLAKTRASVSQCGSDDKFPPPPGAFFFVTTTSLMTSFVAIGTAFDDDDRLFRVIRLEKLGTLAAT